MPHRSELQREVAEALISTKAINFDAIGQVLTKFGERAARGGDGIGVIVNWRLIDVCIPVDWIIRHDMPHFEAPHLDQGTMPGR